MSEGSAKAFLISCETIVDILKEMKVLQDGGIGTYTLNDVDSSSIRAYMGINPKQTEANRQTLIS